MIKITVMEAILWSALSAGMACLIFDAVSITAMGETIRDPAQVHAFRQLNACPGTGLVSGACPGWVVDHKIPLCAGGADSPENMQWQDEKAGHQKDVLEWYMCRQMKHCPATPPPLPVQ